MAKFLTSFLIAMILGIKLVMPQQVVSTGGSFFDSSIGAVSVSLTFGESVIATYVQPSAILTNGFQQPANTFPTISGPGSVCVGSAGNVYLTETGKSNYVWTISAGGSITSTVTSSSTSVTVTWNVAGAQTVSVNYTDTNGFTPHTPTIKNVMVHDLPVPSINGLSSVCLGNTGVVYSTEPGMTNYSWSISGGSITGGSSSNSVTVTWNTAGAQSISVSYTNIYGCTAAAPTTRDVTVHDLPVPTITGNATVCAGTCAVVYTTEAGMTGYSWNISSGGTITAGTGTNSVTVCWNTAGAQTISVNYINGNSCTAASATVRNVTVNALPVPTITGTATLCAGTCAVVYTTEAGMTGYIWNISSGGTTTAGAGTNSVTVCWNTAGAQTISVNYTNANSCTAASATVKAVTVNALPVPTITGNATACIGTCAVIYTTEAGMTGYLWNVSAGGTITAGAGTNSVTVCWNTTGAQTISVNYTNANSCTAVSATVRNVTVHDLPVPTITGNATVCAGTCAVVYTTETGMTGYSWNISSGGTITAGAGTNAVTVCWNTAGAQTISVNYINGNGCTATSATVTNVTVNALPVPTITGTATLCAGTCAEVYTTEAWMTGYIWNISSGGAITAGAGTNSVTVCWNTAGAQTISVNYTNANSCTAASATVKSVTVKALPVPTITGNASACIGTCAVVYTTETGMTGYLWNVSAGGTITAGAGTNSVTVCWNTTGAQTISVNYTSPNGCAAASATVRNVTVHDLPVPTITGNATVCAGTCAVVYTTEAGMTGYIWNISSGGTITAGAGTNSITVCWNTAGAQTISVNYTNSNSCTAASATVKAVTVYALPVPTITGPATLCAGTCAVVYTTEAGMTGYLWTISAGGTITAGAGTNSVTVCWNTAGAQTISVNYTNAYSCTAASATVKAVTVNALPVPTITGNATACIGTCAVVYTTEAGMTGYLWNVSAGGTITSGSGTNAVTVCWNTAGAQTISVNYTNANSCTAASATVKAVTVNALPVPTITGNATACAGTCAVIYTTETGMTGYSWNISSGGSITAGAGTSSITVCWNTAGAQTISVNYINGNGCTATSATVRNVTVNALPVPTITGPATLCAGTCAVVYTTEAGMTGYIWTVSSGGTITAGAGTNSVTVCWNTAGAQTMSVNYTNANSCTAVSATVFAVTVNALPVPTITGNATVCAGTCAVVYTTEAGMTGYSWGVSAGGTITAGSGTNAVTICWNTAGAQTISVNYANANSCTAASATFKNVTVNALPAPTITGPSPVCATCGNVYTTEAGMTGYSWAVSAGGTITAGSGTNAVTVCWNTAGAQTISVNYINGNSCTAAFATVKNISVNALPVPVINGAVAACAGSTGNVYFTDSGMTGYIWTISAGGTITAGAGTSAITVAWNTPGPQSISLNYTDGNGCTAATPTVLNVAVNALPVPAITGASSVCAGSSGIVYSTEAGKTGYTWNIPGGGSITAGTGTNTVTVTWATPGSQTISVNYTDANGCTAANPTVLNVAVHALPVPVITGPDPSWVGSAGNIYSTAAGMTAYIWTVSAGGSITAGSGSNAVTITWTTAGPQTVCVSYTNIYGCMAITPTCKNVTVSVGFNIDGFYTYDKTLSTPIDALTLHLKSNGAIVDNTTTDLSGHYVFTGKSSGTYTISADCHKPWNGVNGTDALQVKYRYLELPNVINTPVRDSAADVNLSYNINGTDANKISRRFVGLDTSFVRGDWTFAKPTGGDTVIVGGTNVTQNFRGLCVGDVNGSGFPYPGKSMALKVTLDNDAVLEVRPGQEFDLPIRVKTDISIAAVSLVIPYPDEYLSLLGVQFDHNGALYQIANHELRFTWSEIQPLNLTGGEILLTLKCRAKERFKGNAVIDLHPNEESEFADVFGEAMPEAQLTGMIIKPKSSIGIGAPDDLVSYVNLFPNPAKDVLHVDIQLQSAAECKLQLIDVLGKVIMELPSQRLGPGPGKITINTGDLPAGMYQIHITARNEAGYAESTQKFIKAR